MYFVHARADFKAASTSLSILKLRTPIGGSTFLPASVISPNRSSRLTRSLFNSVQGLFRFIKGSHQQFDFIFADPPYALDKLSSIPDLVFANNLLKPDAIFVFEHGKNNDFSHHPHFVEHRTYGSVNFSLFRV